MAYEWFVMTDDGVDGPYSSEDIRRMAADGRIGPETRLQRGDKDFFIPARKARGLFTHSGRLQPRQAATGATPVPNTLDGPWDPEAAFREPLTLPQTPATGIHRRDPQTGRLTRAAVPTTEHEPLPPVEGLAGPEAIPEPRPRSGGGSVVGLVVIVALVVLGLAGLLAAILSGAFDGAPTGGAVRP